MKRRELLKHMGAAMPALALARGAEAAAPALPPGAHEAMAPGPFAPNWDSLQNYQAPDWFRNAKFGIWAHWGPQCEPERGDWYARAMYEEGSDAYKHHLQKYGHPSAFGFKDVIREWEAERWNPEELLALYKKAGAKYFVAMANHHDNFDLYASKYQPRWNSTKLGPKKDLIAGWAKAARKQNLPFGVSVHASHAWRWYEPSQGADKAGKLAGVPYDGNQTRADGAGRWWQGLDPQELYAQAHPRSKTAAEGGVPHEQWHWGGGASIPDQAYIAKYYDRTMELINRYDPDLMYFDDTVLPLWPFSDVGLRLTAHMYNRSIARKGKLEAVVNGKILNAQQRKAMVWDVERGQSNQLEPLPWQTCTCIGSWHYDRRVYDKRAYKSAQTVVHTLIDVVSKNGNLLLSVPVRGNGSIDEQERAIVEEIGRWIAVNGEGIYGSRPWTVFGEGPAMEGTAKLDGAGFNEGKNKPFTAADLRFTTKDGALYAFVLGWPADGKLTIKSLASAGSHGRQPVSRVDLVGGARQLDFRRTAQGLQVTLPAKKPALPYAFALRIV